MRIVGGSHRGRIIEPPANLRARPTTDFAKENLFNVLNNLVDFEGMDALDLFAGTGSISYELCSRGAGNVTAVELNRIHCVFIADTARKFGFAGLHVVKANAFLYLKKCGRQFDFIFADPPYDLICSDSAIDLVFDNGLLREGGLLVFEHPGTANFSSHGRFVQSRNYGSVNFSFFR